MHVFGNEHKQGVLQVRPKRTASLTSPFRSRVAGQDQGEGSSVADGEVPYLLPSLHHMEVPAMCSQHSSALSRSQRTDSLQEERKLSD